MSCMPPASLEDAQHLNDAEIDARAAMADGGTAPTPERGIITHVDIPGDADAAAREAAPRRKGGDADWAAKIFASLNMADPGTPPPAPEKAALELVGLQDAVAAALDGDAGAANLFARLNAGRFLYDAAAGQWMVYRDHRWNIDVRNAWRQEGFDKIRDVLRHYAFQEACRALDRKATKPDREAAKANADALQKANQKLGSTRKRNDAGTLAGDEGGLSDAGDRWDAIPCKIPVANGVVEISGDGAELDELGNPDDRLVLGSQTPFDETAECPAFKSAVHAMFAGDKDVILYVQKFFGYAILRNPKERIIVFLTGAGNNGKSLMLATFQRILGGICASIKTELLVEHREQPSADAPSASRLKLRGRGLVFTSEVKANTAFDAGVFKSLTGNDPVVARPPYGRAEITFDPTHVLCVACNDLPRLPASDAAIWTRVVVVNFPVTFTDDPEKLGKGNEFFRPLDKDLGDKFAKEAPGILRWLLEGAVAYLREGLRQPAAVAEATRKYRASVDMIGKFLAECCTLTEPTAKDAPEVPAGQLFKAYVEWCERNRIKSVNNNTFSEDILKRGYHRRHVKRGNRYVGIGILQTDASGADW